MLDEEANKARKNLSSVVISTACYLLGLLCYFVIEEFSTDYILSYVLLGMFVIFMLSSFASCIRTLIVSAKAFKRTNHIQNDLAVIFSGCIIVLEVGFFLK